MRILAYTADADIFCPNCIKRYGEVTGSEYKDMEGNPIVPIFSTSSDALFQQCSNCGEELDPPPADVADEVAEILSHHDGNLSPVDILEAAYALKKTRWEEEVGE